MNKFLGLGTIALLSMASTGAIAQGLNIVANTDTGVSAESFATIETEADAEIITQSQESAADVDAEIVVENETENDIDETDASGGVLVENTISRPLDDAETMVIEKQDEVDERVQNLESTTEIGADVEAATVVEIE